MSARIQYLSELGGPYRLERATPQFIPPIIGWEFGEKESYRSSRSGR